MRLMSSENVTCEVTAVIEFDESRFHVSCNVGQSRQSNEGHLWFKSHVRLQQVLHRSGIMIEHACIRQYGNISMSLLQKTSSGQCFHALLWHVHSTLTTFHIFVPVPLPPFLQYWRATWHFAAVHLSSRACDPNYVHQLDLIDEFLIDVSDHFDDHTLHQASQIVQTMRTELQTLKNFNFVLTMQLLQACRRLQQQLRQHGRLKL